MVSQNIAVIDIGKTNVKLALVDAKTLEEVCVITQPNTVLSGPLWPHFDVDSHWKFLRDGLKNFHATHGVSAISITTHGACCALLDGHGNLAAPILDYEHSGPDEFTDAYDKIRPPFSETGSPRLPMGLNLGAQLYWMFKTDPQLKARTTQIVTYPQFWGHLLTGVAATDVTSLGCHTDLWNPYKCVPSSLVSSLEIEDKIAPTLKPFDVLGPIRHELATELGLHSNTPVYCGIHDSNASLLPKLKANKPPFSVVSTGTWVIAMSIGGKSVTLDPAKDTLVNVNAFGEPVPSARFMGGREFDLLLAGQIVEPTDDDIFKTLTSGTMLLPAVVSENGPFQGRAHRWVGDEPKFGSGERAACVGFYLALATAYCLEQTGHLGNLHVEGPFSRNQTFLNMLSAAMDSPVLATESATGTSQGAALLTGIYQNPANDPPVRQFSGRKDFAAYAKLWRETVKGAQQGR
jgi:sugar (pentulose or hexulose) kinase